MPGSYVSLFMLIIFQKEGYVKTFCVGISLFFGPPLPYRLSTFSAMIRKFNSTYPTIMEVKYTCIPPICPVTAARASYPLAVRYPVIFVVATIPIAMGKVIPAKPGVKEKEKNLGSLITIKAREASTQAYRKNSRTRLGS